MRSRQGFPVRRCVKVSVNRVASSTSSTMSVGIIPGSDRRGFRLWGEGISTRRRRAPPPRRRNRRAAYRASGGGLQGCPRRVWHFICGKYVWSRRRGTRGGGRRGLPRSVHKLLRLSMAGVPSAGRTRSPRCDAILTMKEDALGGFHA